MKKLIYLFFAYSLMLLLPIVASGQPLSYEKTADLVLNDGTIVKIYGTLDSDNYYYLPPNASLRLSRNLDNDFEFNFTKYTTDERIENGGIQGALLHFLFEWGLKPEQLEDLSEQVATTFGGNLRGPVDFQLGEPGKYSIKSGILENGEFSSKTIHVGLAPPIPGSKAAIATKLNKYGAQLIENSFKSDAAIADLSVEVVFEYIVSIKAAEGSITYNWNLYQEQYESLAIDYLKKELDGRPEQWQGALDSFNAKKSEMDTICGLSSSLNTLLIAGQVADQIVGNTTVGGTGGVYEYSAGEKQMRKIYDYLRETEVVELKWRRHLDTEELAVMEAAFFNYFLTGFTDHQFPELISNERIQIESPQNTVIEDAEGVYNFKACEQMTSNRSKNKTIKFEDILLPIKRKHPMTFNLKSAYDDFQREKRYFQKVVLDDPFFEYRDINFILDADAEELFSNKKINYATINVRKKRNDGSIFEDKLTLDRSYLHQKGGRISTSYIRGEDISLDQFEYKVQWSLEGGKVYPANPTWKKGDWEGITLTAPVKSRNIEFEADPGELADLEVTRATLQIRHEQFGKMKEETIQLSTRKEEFAKNKKIFSDSERPDYKYRLIFNHKRLGKIRTDWQDGFNDNYIYGITPERLLSTEEEN